MDQKENSSQDNTNPDAKILEQGTFSIDQRKLLKYYYLLTNTRKRRVNLLLLIITNLHESYTYVRPFL